MLCNSPFVLNRKRSGPCRLLRIGLFFVLQALAHHDVGRDQEEASKEPGHRACDAGGKVPPQGHEPEAHHARAIISATPANMARLE